MKSTVPQILESGRVFDGPFASKPADGFNGVFFVGLADGARLKIVASSKHQGWEHVSVSLEDRCPTWWEMCAVKEMCWEDEEAVMQLHPPRSDYVDFNEFCLHMWRPLRRQIPLPPSELVGPGGRRKGWLSRLAGWINHR